VLWVANSFQEEHRKASKDPLIMLGTAPLHDQFFRTAMFEQLGENKLEVPVVTDIDGRPESHAKRLDREAGDPIKATAMHRKVATAIMFESNGGMSATNTDATLPEIRMAVGTPTTNLADVEHVLDGLATSSTFSMDWPARASTSRATRTGFASAFSRTSTKSSSPGAAP